jgi:hypothetical protein
VRLVITERRGVAGKHAAEKPGEGGWRKPEKEARTIEVNSVHYIVQGKGAASMR